MRGFTYEQNEDFSGDVPVFEDGSELEFENRRFGDATGAAERADDLPISPRQAEACARWMKAQFGAKMQAVTNGTPFSAAILSAMVCQETAYFWISRVNSLTAAEILARCVLDASGEIPDAPRTAFPRNTAAFRNAYGQDFTDLLIAEGNATRALRGFGPRPWVYKGYGIFQYDLQFVRSDEAYFREKHWYDIDRCLNRVMGELKEAFERQGELWEAIRAYNGSGPRARQYKANVKRFHAFCQPVWDSAPVG